MDSLSGAPLKSKGRGFSVRLFIGFIFVFLGLIVFIQIFNQDLIREIPVITAILKYGTAFGSFIAGFLIIFKRKDSSDIKSEK